MARISTFINAEKVIDFLNGEPDITHDELICAVIGLARHVEQLEAEIEKLERQVNPD